jgi:hypothetical protein
MNIQGNEEIAQEFVFRVQRKDQKPDRLNRYSCQLRSADVLGENANLKARI